MPLSEQLSEIDNGWRPISRRGCMAIRKGCSPCPCLASRRVVPTATTRRTTTTSGSSGRGVSAAVRARRRRCLRYRPCRRRAGRCRPVASRKQVRRCRCARRSADPRPAGRAFLDLVAGIGATDCAEDHRHVAAAAAANQAPQAEVDHATDHGANAGLVGIVDLGRIDVLTVPARISISPGPPPGAAQAVTRARGRWR